MFCLWSALLLTASAIQINTEPDVVNTSPVFFFLHRKAGEFLNIHLIDLLKGRYGFDKDWKMVEWHTIQAGAFSHCQDANLIFYQDLNPLTLDKIMQDCPNFRAIHVRRDQVDTLVSNYVYTKNLTLKKDYIDKKHDPSFHGMLEPLDVIMLGEYLKTVPQLQGIKDTCWADATLLGPPTVSSYLKIKTQQMKQILQVRFEDFAEDFDATTRAVFEHIFYNEKDTSAQVATKRAIVDNLVKKAQEYDVSRTTDSMAEDHISNDDDKKAARERVNLLIEEKDPCLITLLQQNRQLGYNTVP